MVTHLQRKRIDRKARGVDIIDGPMVTSYYTILSTRRFHVGIRSKSERSSRDSLLNEIQVKKAFF